MTRDIAAVMDATDTPRAMLVGLCFDGVWRADPPRGRGARARVGHRGLRRRRAAPHAGAPVVGGHGGRGGAAGLRGLGARSAATPGGSTTPTPRRFFFEQIASEPHSTKLIEDAVAWALDGDVDAMIAEADADFPFDRDQVIAICRAVRCPMRLVHGTEDHCQPLDRAQAPGGAHRRPAHRGRRRRPHDPGPPPGPRQPDHPRPRRGHPEERAMTTTRTWTRGAVASPTGAVHLVADRPRPRPAGRGHRRRAAPPPPGPRDRLARPASGHGRPRGPRRADPPGERVAGQRIGPHRRGIDRARAQRLPGDPPHGRDPHRQLHGLPRRRRGRRVRPRHRRRGLGRRLLPPREPGAQADGVRLADRLRRLAADAGRRRSRGLPDGRLQRRDDRAGRALPAHPRPGDLRRRPGRHRARTTSGRTCPAIRDWTERHYAFSGYVTGLRPDAADRGPRGAPARARLPRRRAGGHRHGRRLRASARRCSAGSSMPIRRRAGRSPACA